MPDLEQRIRDCAEELRGLFVGLQRNPANFPIALLERWEKKIRLSLELENTLVLFPARLEAWEVTKSIEWLPISKSENGRDFLVFSGREMDFEIARHISLVAYLTTCWAIYDRLANVVGRIAGVSEIESHKKKNPKLCEDFLGEKGVLGFAGHLPIREAYSWPCKVSYKVRNWLVHEGYYDTEHNLFAGVRQSDGFLLFVDAVEHLKECCSYVRGGNQKCLVDNAADPWDSSDLLKILECYHAEIDRMYCGYLKWATGALALQVRCLLER
jgi:hypothetical protein